VERARLQSFVEQLRQLSEGTDDVALSARVNLADYYRTIGGYEEAEEILAATPPQATSQDVLFAAEMMRGTMYHGKNPLEAITAFKRAAMVAGDRDAFRAAFDGIGATVASNQGWATVLWNDAWRHLDADSAFPMLVCDNAEGAQRAWRLGQPFNVVVKRDFGTLKRVDFVYDPASRNQRPAFIGVIEDRDLYGKRCALWGREAFAISIARDAIPDNWRHQISFGSVDPWGNSVVLE
jgi:hypothetical protein